MSNVEHAIELGRVVPVTIYKRFFMSMHPNSGIM